jgi:hypothetical protein
LPSRMADPERLVKDYLAKHRDRPFSAAQLGGSTSIGEPALRVILDDMVKRGELVGLGANRYLYATNSDVAAFHIMREVAPNITFEEFMAHREEPHLLARMSRDRVIAKDPRGGL